MGRKKSKQKKVNRSFTIDKDLNEALENYAEEHGINVSWVICQALKQFVPIKYYTINSKGILREQKLRP